MLSWLRKEFKTVVAYGIIGLVGFVFVFTGVLNPRATRGLHEGAVAGRVNGESITIPEFNRAYNQRMEMFKSMGGAQFTEEQLKMFRIREGVFSELVKRRLMAQEAKKSGIMASDDEVRNRVAEIPAFQKDGRFDLIVYRSVLSNNNYNPGSFERMLRDDLSVERWQEAFRNRVTVSDAEIERDFLLNEEKRNLKYVYLTIEDGKKAFPISDAELTKWMSDPKKVEGLKPEFEHFKDKEFKGKTFDQVKTELARRHIGSEKITEVTKYNDQWADKVVGLLSSDDKKDTEINNLLKTFGSTVHKTGLVSQSTFSIPGLGDPREILSETFSAQGVSKPKKFAVAGGVVIALGVESKSASLADLPKSRASLMRALHTRKERELMEKWLKKAQESAKIDANPAVVGSADPKDVGGEG